MLVENIEDLRDGKAFAEIVQTILKMHEDQQDPSFSEEQGMKKDRANDTHNKLEQPGSHQLGNSSMIRTHLLSLAKAKGFHTFPESLAKWDAPDRLAKGEDAMLTLTYVKFLKDLYLSSLPPSKSDIKDDKFTIDGGLRTNTKNIRKPRQNVDKNATKVQHQHRKTGSKDIFTAYYNTSPIMLRPSRTPPGRLLRRMSSSLKILGVDTDKGPQDGDNNNNKYEDPIKRDKEDDFHHFQEEPKETKQKEDHYNEALSDSKVKSPNRRVSPYSSPSHSLQRLNRPKSSNTNSFLKESKDKILLASPPPPPPSRPSSAFSSASRGDEKRSQKTTKNLIEDEWADTHGHYNFDHILHSESVNDERVIDEKKVKIEPVKQKNKMSMSRDLKRFNDSNNPKRNIREGIWANHIMRNQKISKVSFEKIITPANVKKQNSNNSGSKGKRSEKLSLYTNIENRGDCQNQKSPSSKSMNKGLKLDDQAKEKSNANINQLRQKPSSKIKNAEFRCSSNLNRTKCKGQSKDRLLMGLKTSTMYDPTFKPSNQTVVFSKHSTGNIEDLEFEQEENTASNKDKSNTKAEYSIGGAPIVDVSFPNHLTQNDHYCSSSPIRRSRGVWHTTIPHVSDYHNMKTYTNTATVGVAGDITMHHVKRDSYKKSSEPKVHLMNTLNASKDFGLLDPDELEEDKVAKLYAMQENLHENVQSLLYDMENDYDTHHVINGAQNASPFSSPIRQKKPMFSSSPYNIHNCTTMPQSPSKIINLNLKSPSRNREGLGIDLGFYNKKGFVFDESFNGHKVDNENEILQLEHDEVQPAYIYLKQSSKDHRKYDAKLKFKRNEKTEHKATLRVINVQSAAGQAVLLKWLQIDMGLDQVDTTSLLPKCESGLVLDRKNLDLVRLQSQYSPSRIQKIKGAQGVLFGSELLNGVLLSELAALLLKKEDAANARRSLRYIDSKDKQKPRLRMVIQGTTLKPKNHAQIYHNVKVALESLQKLRLEINPRMLYAVAKIADGRQDCIWTLLGDIYDAFHQPSGAKNIYTKNSKNQMNKLSVPTSPIKITKQQQKRNEQTEETAAMLTSHTRSAPGSILGHIDMTQEAPSKGSGSYVNPNSGVTIQVEDMKNDMVMPNQFDTHNCPGVSILLNKTSPEAETRKLEQMKGDKVAESSLDFDTFMFGREETQKLGDLQKEEKRRQATSLIDNDMERKDIEERFLRIHSPTRIREHKTGINVPRSEWIGEDQYTFRDPNKIKYNLGEKKLQKHTERTELSQKYKQLLKNTKTDKHTTKFSSSNSYSLLKSLENNSYTNRKRYSTETRYPDISSKDEEEIRSWLLELGLYPPIPLSRRISNISFNSEKSYPIHINREKENVNCLMNSTLGSDNSHKNPFLFHSNIYSTNKPSKHCLVADLDNDLQTYNYDHSTNIMKIFPLKTLETSTTSESGNDPKPNLNVTSITMSQSSGKNNFNESSTNVPYAAKHFLTDPLRNGLILTILFRTLEPDMAGQVSFEKKLHKYPIQSLKQVKENVAKVLWLFRMKKSPPIPIRFLNDVQGIIQGEYNLTWGLLQSIKDAYMDIVYAPIDSGIGQSQTLPDSLFSSENISNSNTKAAKYTTIDESVSSLGQEGVSIVKRTPNNKLREIGDKKDLFLKHLGYTLESKRKMESALIYWFHSMGLVDKDLSDQLPRTIYPFFPYFQDGTLLCRIAEIVLDCNIKGWIEKPRTKDVCLRNIHKAIVCLRRSSKKISNRFLIAEKIEESIYDGEVAVILGLCEDIYRFSDGLIPYSNVIPSSSILPHILVKIPRGRPLSLFFSSL